MAKDANPSGRPEATARPAERMLGRAAIVSSLRLQTWFLGIIAAAIVLFVLVQARFLLITLVVAIILFSLTSDAINSIARLRFGPLRIPNWAATVVAVLLISAGLLTLSAIVLSEINTVLSTALAYADQAQLGLAELFAWMGQDVETAVMSSIRSIEIGAYLRALAAQAGNFFSGTVLVVLFVGFLFAERVWFDTKLTLLTGDPDRAARIGAIIASIMRRVNRYLLVKSLVSLVTGGLVYAVMMGFGLQFAEASGVITFVLNFIPNVGSVVATVLVTLIASVQVSDPGAAVAIFLIVTAIQFIVGNVIDPTLMGRALRLSSFGILLSLAFWGAVWGVPGMFLSVPILVAVMIVCAHIPALRPVAVLLSREGLPEEEMPSLGPSPEPERGGERAGEPDPTG